MYRTEVWITVLLLVPSLSYAVDPLPETNLGRKLWVKSEAATIWWQNQPKKCGKKGKKCATSPPSEIHSMVPSLAPSEPTTMVPTHAPVNYCKKKIKNDKKTQDPDCVHRTNFPTQGPSLYSDTPSLYPSSVPSSMPSFAPSMSPSDLPSALPSLSPSASPSEAPSDVPSASPSDYPSPLPSASPSDSPSTGPSEYPSPLPSASPSDSPSSFPSQAPSCIECGNKLNAAMQKKGNQCQIFSKIFTKCADKPKKWLNQEICRTACWFIGWPYEKDRDTICCPDYTAYDTGGNKIVLDWSQQETQYPLETPLYDTFHPTTSPGS